MLLADPTAIREGLGFDDMTDINSAIKQTLNAAEPFLASRMNMETFARSDSIDVFWVPQPTFKNPPMVNTVFRLSSGLLTAVTAITKSSAADQFDSTDATDLTGALQVHLSKGIVSDFLTDYDMEFVRIKHTHGFVAASADPDSYDLSQVPSWLQQAASLQATILLANHAAIKNTGVEIDTKTVRYQLDILMANNIRYAPNSIMPL